MSGTRNLQWLLFTYIRSRVMTPMRNPLPKMGTKKLLTIGTMKMKKEEKNFLKKNLTIITKKMFTNPQDQWFLCQKCSGWFQWFGLKNKTIVIVNHTTISTLSSFLQVTSDKFLFWSNHEIFFLGLENSLPESTMYLTYGCSTTHYYKKNENVKSFDEARV